MRRVQAVLTLGAAFLAVAAPVGRSSLAQRVGVPEWTSQVAVGQPPEAESRRLVPGLPMQFREAVSTDERGAADFIFNNSARLLVGPDCGLTLDERFYDPELDLDVVRASMRTDTFCVTRVDRVRALRLDGAGPGEAETGSLAAVVGEGAETIAAGGGAVVALQFETATLVMVDTDALVSAGAPGEGLRAFKTSSEGLLYVFAGDSSLVLRRADFDAQVTPDGRLVGPNRTDPAVLKTAQQRLQAIEPAAVQRADLPYVLEPLPLAGLQERPARDRPDHCLLTDTCIGFERVVEFVEIDEGEGSDEVNGGTEPTPIP